jgi:hypothetical protein
VPLSLSRITLFVCAGLLAAFWSVYGFLFPAVPAGLGHDYNLHYPNLLAGYFFIEQNGWFAAPWFSPAQCAGTPYLGDLNVMFHSAPQVFAVFGGPAFAVQATVVLFAALGLAGTVALARDTLQTSLPAALLAAALVLFNGFFVYRMAIGHLTFHPIMLIPAAAWLTVGGPALGRYAGPVLRALMVGAAFALMVEAGMVHGVLPAVLVIAGVWAWTALRSGRIDPAPVLILGAAAVVAGLLSAARLQAALAFLSHFPRADYPLPGFASVWDALRAPFEAVFLTPPDAWAEAATVNRKWSLARHEWEYGLSAFALIVLAVGVLRAGLAAALNRSRIRIGGARLFAAAVFAVVLIAPVVVNIHGEAWTAFLKTVPVLGQSSSLVRWYVVYTFLFGFLCAPALDAAIDAGRWRRHVSVGLIAGVIAWSVLEDRTHYAEQTYDGRPIQASYEAVAAGAPVPAVEQLVMTVGSGAGRFNPDVNRNNAMARGESELLCNQPLFGYTLENFPLMDSFTGGILEEDGWGGINLKNPACYLYPDENGCTPGEGFAVENTDDALAFAAYKAFPFERPLRHDAAAAVNIAAVLLWPLAVGVLAWRRRRTGPHV